MTGRGGLLALYVPRNEIPTLSLVSLLDAITLMAFVGSARSFYLAGIAD